MSKKPVKSKPAAKRATSARPSARPAVRTPAPRDGASRDAKPKRSVVSGEPMQFEFGKLLDVVERQSSRTAETVLKPDASTRAAIEAIVRRENELIRKALRKLKKTPAWVRQQWAELGASAKAAPLSEAFTPDQYADRVRLNDRAVPPPGAWRTKLLEAGRKLKS